MASAEQVGQRKRSRETAEAEASCDIYVEGFPYTATEDEIRELFGACGEITSLRLPRCAGSAQPDECKYSLILG